MNSDDTTAFASLLSDALAFYRQDVSSFALGVWWQACSPFSLEQVRKALTAHALDPERGQFAPKPADLVRQLQGTHADRSLIAWGKVLDAIQRVGAYQTVVFDDPAIHAAIVDMGGWVAICRSNVDDLPFVQKRFCDAHRTYAKRTDIGYPAMLVGEHAQQNGALGFEAAPPLLIGDPKRAQHVLKRGGAAKTLITTMTEAGQVLRLEDELQR